MIWIRLLMREAEVGEVREVQLSGSKVSGNRGGGDRFTRHQSNAFVYMVHIHI